MKKMFRPPGCVSGHDTEIYDKMFDALKGLAATERESHATVVEATEGAATTARFLCAARPLKLACVIAVDDAALMSHP